MLGYLGVALAGEPPPSSNNDNDASTPPPPPPPGATAASPPPVAVLHQRSPPPRPTPTQPATPVAPPPPPPPPARRKPSLHVQLPVTPVQQPQQQQQRQAVTAAPPMYTGKRHLHGARGAQSVMTDILQPQRATPRAGSDTGGYAATGGGAAYRTPRTTPGRQEWGKRCCTSKQTKTNYLTNTHMVCSAPNHTHDRCSHCPGRRCCRACRSRVCDRPKCDHEAPCACRAMVPQVSWAPASGPPSSCLQSTVNLPCTPAGASPPSSSTTTATAVPTSRRRPHLQPMATLDRPATGVMRLQHRHTLCRTTPMRRLVPWATRQQLAVHSDQRGAPRSQRAPCVQLVCPVAAPGGAQRQQCMRRGHRASRALHHWRQHRRR